MDRGEVERLIESVPFREHVLDTCGYPDYHRNERGFLYYPDSSFSPVFEGVEDKVVIPPELDNKQDSLFVHYHPDKVCGPSNGDIFNFFIRTVLQIPKVGVQYFGIVSQFNSHGKDDHHPVLVMYSYRPIIEAHLDKLLQVRDGTRITMDEDRFKAGLDQEEILAHLLYDKVLRESGFSWNEEEKRFWWIFSFLEVFDSERARDKLARNKNLEVLSLIHFRD